MTAPIDRRLLLKTGAFGLGALSLPGGAMAAMQAALAPLNNPVWGDEPLPDNRLAAEWLARVDALAGQGRAPEAAGREAALRIFGDAPGA